MACSNQTLLNHLELSLDAGAFRDYGYNGLQVEGQNEITCIASSATASLAVIEDAIAQGANALLVHHGIIWGGVDHIAGMLRQRLTALLGANCNLFAYHLPLDAHPELGNSRKALDRLQIPYEGGFANYKGQPIGRWGTITEGISVAELSQRCAEAFAHPVVHCPGDDRVIKRVGVVTGGGQSYLMDAHAHGLDALVTGEASEQTWHEAAESGTHCFSCGHYATESIAVHELAASCASEFGLQHIAIDQANPI